MLNSISRASKVFSPAGVLNAVGLALGPSALLGWMFDVEWLRSFVSGAVAMNPLTAIGVTIAGSAPMFSASRKRGLKILGRACSCFLILIGTIKLAEFFGLSFELDQIFFTSELGKPAFPIPNRMAPNTALFFVLLGAAQLLATSASKARIALSQMVALGVALFSLFAVVGYILNTDFLYGFAGYIPMAVNTAAAFLVLSLAVPFAHPQSKLMSIVKNDERIGSIMARRLLPMAIFLPVLIGWMRLEGQRRGLFTVEFGVSIMTTVMMLSLISIVLWSAGYLNRLDEINRKSLASVKELNEKLVRSLADLEVLNKELETFSYSVSHDLRAPLRSIAGFSNVLIEDCADELNPSGKEYLARIFEAARRMGSLIDGLLNLSRLGRQSLSTERVNVSQLAASISAEISALEDQRHVEFEIDADMIATADLPLLRVVLENLIGNAWKFTSKREKAKIEVGHKFEGQQQVFFVRDNGAGFDMAYAGKLFGAFQRLHVASEFEGTGIGLATVQRVISRHGGEIWAEAALDRGTTIYFTLGTRRGAERLA